jgi:hypothetical protein
MSEPISNSETDWSELPPNVLARADRVTSKKGGVSSDGYGEKT